MLGPGATALPAALARDASIAYRRGMTQSRRAFLWWAGAAAAVMLAVLALGWQTVTCPTSIGPAGGDCVREPSVEQSIVMAVLCAGAALFCGWRAVRARRTRS